MGIFYHALSESTDAQLDHGSVVQDLGQKKTNNRFFNLWHSHLQVCSCSVPVSACLPVRAGQRAGCCPAGGSSASGRGPGTSVNAERGDRCGRG